MVLFHLGLGGNKNHLDNFIFKSGISSYFHTTTGGHLWQQYGDAHGLGSSRMWNSILTGVVGYKNSSTVCLFRINIVVDNKSMDIMEFGWRNLYEKFKIVKIRKITFNIKQGSS